MVSGAIGRVLTTNVTDAEPLGVDPAAVVIAIVTFLAAFVLARVTSNVLNRVAEETVEHRIAVKALVPAVSFGLYIVAVVLVLGPVLNLTASQLLAFSGILGAVLGLGIQDLFANIVGGFVVAFERPYRLGDKVKIGEHYGEVTEIGLRSTRLYSDDDNEISVPNHRLFTESLANANDGDPELMVITEIHLAHSADIETARALLRDAMRSSRYVYVSPDHPVVVRIDQQPTHVTLRGRAFVGDIRDEFAFESDVRDRTIAALDERAIERPDLGVLAER